MKLSEFWLMASISGCRTLKTFCATHCAACPSQQLTSNGAQKAGTVDACGSPSPAPDKVCACCVCWEGEEALIVTCGTVACVGIPAVLMPDPANTKKPTSVSTVRKIRRKECLCLTRWLSRFESLTLSTTHCCEDVACSIFLLFPIRNATMVVLSFLLMP